VIDVKNVTKSYGAFDAVKDISFTVEQGEILGFLGPNGAGKTTTMKMITCYMPPTHGVITVDGLDVVNDSMRVRQKIGYLPESTPLYEEMGVRDYLNFVADVRKINGVQRNQALDRVIAVCGLQKVIHKDIYELSKGFRQRVGFAQAILHDPEILILDEPTTGLDPNQIIEIRNLIRELGTSKTVIFSTHIMQEVEAICDRVIIINNGKIIADDKTENLSKLLGSKESILIELNKDVNLSDLKTIRGVNDVIKTAEKKYELISANHEDVRKEVFEWAVQSEVQILSMNKKENNLENIFRQLTNQDNSAK